MGKVPQDSSCLMLLLRLVLIRRKDSSEILKAIVCPGVDRDNLRLAPNVMSLGTIELLGCKGSGLHAEEPPLCSTVSLVGNAFLFSGRFVRYTELQAVV